MLKPSLIIATNNQHKLEEIAHFVGDKFELLSLQQIGFEGDIEETGSTLSENSLIKAQYIWDKYQKNCLADDSGLEVYSLNYEPGVFSARYAGQHRNHDDNMNLLLANLKGKSNRLAQFRTVITSIIGGKIYQFEGIVKGKIITEKLGNEGFGYDPIFVPDGFNKTFAEMSLTEKTGLSHRTRALQQMVKFLEK